MIKCFGSKGICFGILGTKSRSGEMSSRRIWIIVAICSLVLLTITIFALTDFTVARAASDCWAYAYKPITNLTSFTGSGKVLCTTTRSRITVVYNVEFEGALQYYPAKTKYCYNTTVCSWSLTVNKVGARRARSATSGYVLDWQGGTQSVWANP